jgi:hypothetical protein
MLRVFLDFYRFLSRVFISYSTDGASGSISLISHILQSLLGIDFHGL